MKAVVYVVLDGYGNDMTLYTVTGTQEAALREYREYTGRPGRVVDTVTDQGYQNLILDKTVDGQGVIAAYEVEISEIVDEKPRKGKKGRPPA